MEILRGLMLEVLKNTNASIMVLAEMLKDLKTCRGIYVIRSIYLFDDMGEHILLMLNNIHQDAGSDELKSDIQDIYKCASMLIEMDIMLLRTIDKAKCGELMAQLDSHMNKVQEVLIKGAWELVRIYGPRKAVSIVTPGYQAMSGIWKEYRKAVLPIEA
ncbi:MAG: hypothetical protein Q8930_07195 [Bacillota bacterium]|nr:hypothetical protein [Bacillota bacterium]